MLGLALMEAGEASYSGAMNYLNYRSLENISAQAFRQQQPYPYAEIEGALTDEGFERLRQALPDVALFDRHVGLQRGYGQAGHDRYMLHYVPGLEVPEPWQEFIAELHGEAYQRFLRAMLGRRKFILSMGLALRLAGDAPSRRTAMPRARSQAIFSISIRKTTGSRSGAAKRSCWPASGACPPTPRLRLTSCAWRPRRRPSATAACSFSARRTPGMAVRPLRCPPEAMRKLFHLTINVPSWQVWWRQLRGKDPDGYRPRRPPMAARACQRRNPMHSEVYRRNAV